MWFRSYGDTKVVFPTVDWKWLIWMNFSRLTFWFKILLTTLLHLCLCLPLSSRNSVHVCMSICECLVCPVPSSMRSESSHEIFCFHISYNHPSLMHIAKTHLVSFSLTSEKEHYQVNANFFSIPEIRISKPLLFFFTRTIYVFQLFCCDFFSSARFTNAEM